MPILLNEQGYVIECGTENIFIAKGGTLMTSPVSIGILPGITRDTVFKLAGLINLKVEEVLITRYDLYSADEVFITGTAVGIMPVRNIDNVKISSGNWKITKNLQELYLKCLSSRLKEFRKFLTKINLHTK